MIEEVSNDANGMIQFSQLSYTSAGTHTYQVKEVRGSDTGISYDTHAETVTVDVKDDGAGNLTATATYDADGVLFSNHTKPGTLTVGKLTDGSGTGNEVFTFEVELTDPFGLPLPQAQAIGG